MNLISTPKGIIDFIRPGQGISDLKTAGFDQILLDLSMFCAPGELEDSGQNLPGRAGKETKPRISEEPSKLYATGKSLLRRYQEAGMQTPIARVPYLFRNTKRTDLNELLLTLAGESIRLCKETGCETVLVRPLFSGLDRKAEWSVNRKFYLSLLPLARESQVKILLENQCYDVGGHLVRGMCSEAEEAAFWVDKLNEEAGEERFGFCMDVGVCNLCGLDMQEFACVLGKRIKAVILRDGDGSLEMSALPFTCAVHGKAQTDWLGLIRGLRRISFNGQVVLDFSDTAAAFSPLLRPQLLQLAKDTADYFMWQIGMEEILKRSSSRVLFGAGNMCRNYMKCYGEKYPPLFTCDNNPKLWGTTFCGLEVKSPEHLKELPADCTILICNVYYREIEKQLRGMGVSGRIECFNDEYMPSFYYDRLERR